MGFNDPATPVRTTGDDHPLRVSAADAALLLAAVIAAGASFSMDAWWFPSYDSRWAVAIAAGLLLSSISHRIDRRLGFAAAALLLGACALLAPPQFSLWGDGALRLRNLEQGIGVWQAAPLEAGDYLLRRGLMVLGVGARATYRVTGIAGGLLFLSGATLAVSGLKRGWAASAAWTFVVAQTSLVFFTGYIESYALVTGLASLTVGLSITARRPASMVAALLAACSQHLMGLLLVPGIVLHLRSCGSRRMAAFAAGGAAAIALAAAAAGGPSTFARAAAGAAPDPLSRLLLVLLACPAWVFLPWILRQRPGAGSMVTIAILLAAFAFFPLERGEAVDWDLAASFLAPVSLALTPHLRMSPVAGAVVAASACILGGPRIAVFIDPAAGESRFVSVMEGNAGAIEEYAILQRDRSRFTEAADLFERAYGLSGNGRHLSQASEALRLAGMPGRALETAREAAGLRPDVETVWLQLALAARDAGSTADALHAARRHSELFEDTPELWALALETAVFADDVRAACEASDSALALGDSSVQVLVNSGIAAFMAGDTARAEILLLEATRRDPGNPLPHRNLAALYIMMGDSAAARFHSSLAGR
jgi:tetratricopeptide (TPR) repeat protein